MTDNTSPPPLSDDSAFGSMASNNANNQNISQMTRLMTSQTTDGSTSGHTGRGSPIRKKFNFATILQRLIRTNLPHLDISDHISQSCHSIKFISKGTLDCSSMISRPVSMLWPDSEIVMTEELKKLDTQLLETNFDTKPIDWMISNNLTDKPTCNKCRKEMILILNNGTAIWHCPIEYVNHCALVQRPTCFKDFENIGFFTLLYSIYHWSICTPLDGVLELLALEPKVVQNIWRRLQKVCVTALEKSYPRFRLYSNPEGTSSGNDPIDLIFMKINKIYVVCGKHPRNNCVRLGRCGSKIAELTQGWFAHGAQIRVCQSKFLDLKKLRTDLEVNLAPLSQMVLKDGSVDPNSAFGYLISLLTNTFKEFDSTTLQKDSIRYLLAETEWRELYGKTPHEAFTNIIKHIGQYYKSTAFQFLTVEEAENEFVLENDVDEERRLCEKEEIFAEKYYYATIYPIDKDGVVIKRYEQEQNSQNNSSNDTTFLCHVCKNHYFSFDYSLHTIAHVESVRRKIESKTLSKSGMIECKHCFRILDKNNLESHAKLMKMDLQTVKFGCRICCLQFEDQQNYLDHMSKFHGMHETPYKCPCCNFASSFQREVFVHFQEEHRHEYVILCPICLRSFTISDPGRLSTSLSVKASQLFHKHISDHYKVAHQYSCDCCNLCFLNKNKLSKHKKSCHDLADEIAHNLAEVKLQPFIVTKEEEEFCIRVNLKDLKQAQENSAKSRLTAEQEDSESYQSSPYVSRVPSPSDSQTTSTYSETTSNQFFTTLEIIESLSKLDQIDEIDSQGPVILTPSGPAKCVECMAFVTATHLKASIDCPNCSYSTHCLMASDNHQVAKHNEL